MKAIMGESVLILHDGFTILPSDTLKVKIRFFFWNALAFESRVCKCKSRVDYDKNFFWNFCFNFFLDLLAYEIKEPAGISKRKFCHFLLYYSYIVCTIYPAMTSVNCTFLHILDHFVILTCALSLCFSSLWETTQTLFWAIFGLVDLDNFELTGIKEFSRFTGLLMFGSFSVINIIVLLNLLIAMMNHSYQLISVSSVSIAWALDVHK